MGRAESHSATDHAGNNATGSRLNRSASDALTGASSKGFDGMGFHATRLLTGTAAATREAMGRRESARRSERIDVWLLCVDGSVMIHGRTENVSETSLYAVLPAGYGVHCGQQYWLMVHQPSPWPGHTNTRRAIGRVRVIRRERLNDDNGESVGVGMVFDWPSHQAN